MKIFFDGGYRPAPVGMELAVVVGGRTHVRQRLGAGTSMDAEWLALIEAMRVARAFDLADPLLVGDAAAVIAQAKGVAKCPDAFTGHYRLFASLGWPPDRVRIRCVKRTQNLAGIALAKLHERL